MKQNHIRATLKQGKTTVGTWLTLPDPVGARLMAKTGFDWLTVELEHTSTDIQTAALSFVSILASDGVPLARVPSNTPENIKRVLDNGAWGVVVPMVNSKEEAAAAVAACRYPPHGNRAVGGQLHAAAFQATPSDYYQHANEQILLVVMIENWDAVQAVDEILSVPGIDVAFIGPNDLLSSMGHPPAFDSDDRKFNQALEKIRQTAEKHGVAPGIHVVDAAAARQRLDEGFRFIAVASEAGMMLNKAAEIVRTLGLGPGKTIAKY